MAMAVNKENQTVGIAIMMMFLFYLFFSCIGYINRTYHLVNPCVLHAVEIKHSQLTCTPDTYYYSYFTEGLTFFFILEFFPFFIMMCYWLICELMIGGSNGMYSDEILENLKFRNFMCHLLAFIGHQYFIFTEKYWIPLDFYHILLTPLVLRYLVNIFYV